MCRLAVGGRSLFVPAQTPGLSAGAGLALGLYRHHVLYFTAIALFYRGEVTSLLAAIDNTPQ
jgi:hypothetical protein